MSYRVIYGETMPAWERIFPTMREAKAFAKEHESFGDVIFSIKKVSPSDRPESMTAMIAVSNEKREDAGYSAAALHSR